MTWYFKTFAEKTYNRTVFIYGLTDPEGNVRYVGKSTDPERRLSEHLREARKGRRSHRDSWLRRLLSDGKRPTVKILEEVYVDSWGASERRWIAALPNLTNHQEGGQGGFEHLSKAQLRENALRMNRLKTSEERSELGRRMGASGRGKKHSSEHIEKLRVVGKAQAAERVARLQAGRKGSDKVRQHCLRMVEIRKRKQEYENG